MSVAVYTRLSEDHLPEGRKIPRTSCSCQACDSTGPSYLIIRGKVGTQLTHFLGSLLWWHTPTKRNLGEKRTYLAYCGQLQPIIARDEKAGTRGLQEQRKNKCMPYPMCSAHSLLLCSWGHAVRGWCWDFLYQLASARSFINTLTPRPTWYNKPVVLNPWVLTPFGVIYWMSCISDIYNLQQQHN